MTTVVIIGASLAGIRCAEGLRAAGFGGRVIVAGEEPGRPYDRPGLSKEHLLDPDVPVRYLVPDAGELPDVELRLGVRADGVEVADRRVVTADGGRIPYDHLVVTTGARARPSPWPVRGVHLLRTLDDATALAAALRRGGPVVVVGAGFIGAEVAAAARAGGLDVTVVDPLPHPLARAIGPEAGRRLVDLHEDRGTRLRLSTGVEGISARSGGFEVHLADGHALRAATVVVAIGAVPNDAWLSGSGLDIADGVVCDEHCRAIGAPGVHAAGDVAAVHHVRLGRPVRHEHWTSAVEQAGCVANDIAHPEAPRPFSSVEYVWSDQYGVRVQLVGRPADGTTETVVDDPGSPGRVAVLASGADGALLGAVMVDWPRATVDCRRALSAGESAEEALERVRRLLVDAA